MHLKYKCTLYEYKIMYNNKMYKITYKIKCIIHET